jgi:small-conductance mechanosensitive channel
MTASVGRSADAPPANITRDQATQLLETLKDPERREHFTATLEAYVKALPLDGKVATPAAAKSPHGPGPLKRAFSRIETAGTHMAQDLRSVTDLQALSAWLGSRWHDPTERDAFNQGSLRIALIMAITIGVEALLRWLMHRRLARPSALPPSGPQVPRLLPTLRRLWARFGAIAGAALAGNAAIVLVADLPAARAVAFGIVNTFLGVRLVLALLDEFVRAEHAPPSAGAPARQLPAGLRCLLAAFLIVVALQLLSGDIADALAAPDAIQEALAKSIALIAHVLAVLIVLVSRASVSTWIRQRSRPGTYWAAVTDALAAIWPAVAICAIVGSWLVWALDVPDLYREILRLVIATLAVLLVSRFITNLVLRTLDRRMTGLSSAPAGTVGSRLFGYRKAAHRVLQLMLFAATLLVLTEAWGLPSLAWLGDGHPGHRFAEFTLRLLVLAAVGIVCWEAADLAFERRVSSLVDTASLSRATRLRTLQPIIRFALLVLIALLVVMTALNAIGINVGPLLAGASIVGVALGFGSQKLVQDFITGIFLLVEDAMDVGDWVTLAGVSGTVEHISIRSIRLRGGDGSVYLVPFSSVTSVNNTNRGLGNAAVTVNVDPSEDTDRVSALLVDIARQMRQEPEYAASMQSDLQLWGVDKVDGSLVVVAGQIVCTDAGRWGVQREFNRRMKLRFEQEGVKLAVPQQILRIAPPVESGTNHRLSSQSSPSASAGAPSLK